MGIKNTVTKIANKAGDRVAKLSALSPEQIEQVQRQREDYLLEKPNPNDELAIDTTQRMMAASSIEIYNAYLSQIKELYLPIEKNSEYPEAFNPNYNIRYFNITKWVQDKKENSLEKLVNVYAVLSDEDCNIALVFNRTQKRTNVYLAVVNTNNANNNVDINSYKNRLIEAIRGNFPGAQWEDEGMGIIPCMKNEKPYSVATASNIPAMKSEKFISQTIEKLLDGIIPTEKKKEYTIVLLATPIKDVEERKLKLGEFYSGLAPYASWETNFTYSENQSASSSATVGVNIGASAGVQNGTNSSSSDTYSQSDNSSKSQTDSQSDSLSSGQSTADSSSSAHTDATNSSETQSSSTTHTDGSSSTQTDTSGSSDTVGSSVSVGESTSVGAYAGTNTYGVSAGASASMSNSITATGSYDHSWNRSTSNAVGTSTSDSTTSGLAQTLGRTASDTLTKGITNTVSQTVAQTTGTAVVNTLGKAVTKAMATTSGLFKSTSLGMNFGANFARSSTVTAMIGKNEGITQSFTNFNIKHALELLEEQMKRLEQSTALGMWDFAAYVLSENYDVANNVAHSYLALTLGEESYMSKSAVNVWRGCVEEEREAAKEIVDYIRELRHPLFALNEERIKEDRAYNVYPSIVTATTSLSGKELAYSLNFPQKSVAGFPVLECAGFGRSVVTYQSVVEDARKIKLGSVLHMNHEENTSVSLVTDSLASHTFITGSTGSGKSNTVYHILKGLKKQGVKFLVIEPAKGEYKNIFGTLTDVSVFGTNPRLTPMLRINPFSFPDDIHILEHLDRLVEIFNVCWPMYAAMPAVLKNAIEKSYEDCGWNLLTSENKYSEKIYPHFSDVSRNVKSIIDSSEYDAENKGAYKGSLLTRLNSLTNGLNGLIFTTDEQISELAKLPCGVGAVYQNEWVQPVLCKIDKYSDSFTPYKYTPNEDLLASSNDAQISKALLDSIMKKELWGSKNKNELKTLKELVVKSKLETTIKCEYLDYISGENKDDLKKLRALLYDLLAAEEAIVMAKDCDNINDWIHKVVENLNPSLQNYSHKQIDMAMALILYEKSSRNPEYNNVFGRFTEIYKAEGGVF